jgi:Transglycosylase SLT domain
MRPILALGFLLLGVSSAASEPKHPDSLVAAATDAPSAADAPLSEPIAIDRLIGSVDLKNDVEVPSLEAIEASHEQQDSVAEPPPSGEAATAPTATDRDVETLDGLCNTLFDSAQQNDLPVPFFANLIWQESGLRHDAVSPVGAQGIAQFMPPTAAAVGLANPFDPRQALPASARLLHELRERFRNLGFAAAAYNAGEHRVSEWLQHGGKLPRETQNYVVSITGRSVDAWRKSPIDDSALRFVRPLPCRKLPAFAGIEQAQAEQTPEPAPEESHEAHAAAVEPAPVARRRFAWRPRMRVIRHEVARRFAIVTHGGMQARWVIPAQASAGLAPAIATGGQVMPRVIRARVVHSAAGNFHGGRIEARHHQQQRVTHGRRIALGVARDPS